MTTLTFGKVAQVEVSCSLLVLVGLRSQVMWFCGRINCNGVLALNQLAGSKLRFYHQYQQEWPQLILKLTKIITKCCFKVEWFSLILVRLVYQCLKSWIQVLLTWISTLKFEQRNLVTEFIWVFLLVEFLLVFNFVCQWMFEEFLRILKFWLTDHLFLNSFGQFTLRLFIKYLSVTHQD